MQILVHTDMKSTKESIFQQKTQKSIHSWSNHFWNPIANVSVKAIRENFNLKPETKLKKLNPITKATIPINTIK